MAIFSEDISINSIIGNGSAISGDIRINGVARIDGDLDGNLEASGNVILGEKSRIRGDIIAKSITVGGIVKGNIFAKESVRLLSTSVVLGDIQTRKMIADENVLFTGHCISLSNNEDFDKAVLEWEDRKEISSKRIKITEE